MESKTMWFQILLQKKAYRFGITWGQGNDDRILMFVWTVPFKKSKQFEDFYTDKLTYISCYSYLYSVLYSHTYSGYKTAITTPTAACAASP